MQIYQQNYISLDKEIREKLIKVFNIQKSQVCEIIDQRLISDGVGNNDLLVVSCETMAEYLGVDSNQPFSSLWEETLKKINIELHPELYKYAPMVTGTFTGIETLDDAIKASEEKKPYCGACVSHKGRHSKNCITNNIIE